MLNIIIISSAPTIPFKVLPPCVEGRLRGIPLENRTTDHHKGNRTQTHELMIVQDIRKIFQMTWANNMCFYDDMLQK